MTPETAAGIGAGDGGGSAGGGAGHGRAAAADETRRGFLGTALASGALMGLTAGSAATAQAGGTDRPPGSTAQAGGLLVYVGAYAGPGRAEGISVFRMDPSTAAVSHVQTLAGVDNPSVLAFQPQRPYLYAVNEIGMYEGERTGSASALALNQDTGRLISTGQVTEPRPRCASSSAPRRERHGVTVVGARLVWY